MKTALRAAAVVLLLALLLPALSAACPLCKEAASEADKPGATSMWRGMYWSILLMVGAPFAMVGTMIIAVRRTRRRLLDRMPRPAPPLPFPDSRGDRS